MKKIMPFWFLDVVSTEETLCRQAQQGMVLKSFSPLGGVFTFEEGEKKAARYRICQGSNAPKGLTAAGWTQVCATGHFYAVRHENPMPDNLPGYKKWKTANRILIAVLFLILCFFLGVLLGMALGNEDTAFALINKPMFVTSAVIDVVLIAAIAALLRINRRLCSNDSDLKLKGGVIKTIPEENFIYTRQQEKEMLRKGEMIKRSPIGWFYAPDKAEKMVEDMAEKGWIFYRFNRVGTVFYFVKGESTRMRFVVDYQNEATEEYFSTAKDDGWKLEFTSITRITCFVVWSKNYGNGIAPEFYSDSETNLKRARRLAFTLGMPMIFFAALFIFFSVDILNTPVSGMGVILAAVYLVLTVEYSLFGMKAIGYYIRMKRNYDLKGENL